VEKTFAPDGSVGVMGHNGELLNSIAKSLNFTPNLNFVTGNMPWGAIFDNGSSFGALGELYNNRTEMIVGDMYLKSSRYQHLDSTKTIDLEQMVFMIPPGRLYTSFEKFLLPFSLNVWLLTLLVIFIGIVTICVISFKLKHLKSFVYGKGVTQPAMNMLLIVVALQQTKLPTTNFARFLLIQFIIFCLIMRTGYVGSLYGFLQSEGRHKEVTTIDQMIEENFKFYIFRTSVDLIKDSEIIKRVEFFKKGNWFFQYPPDGTQNIAALENMRRVVKHNQKSNVTIKYCKEHLMSINIVWYLKKHSPYKQIIDSKIDSILSGGIYEYWLTSYRGNSVKSKPNENELRQISLENLSGIFGILLVGHLLAAVAFIVEIYSIKERTLNN
jgi:Ligand-gated ion channel